MPTIIAFIRRSSTDIHHSNQKYIDSTKTTLHARDFSCNKGKWNVSFDDTDVPSDQRPTYLQSPQKMNNGFYWSAGFVPRPGYSEKAQAISQPNLLSYEPDLNTVTKDSRAEMTTLNENRFNAYGAYLGCQDPRVKEDDCHMTIFGLRDGKQVAKKDFEHIPSCGKECVLKRFDFGKDFQNLTSLQFKAKDDGKPQHFAMDNLELEYVKDNCQAAAFEITGQPTSSSIVEPTAVWSVDSPMISSVSKVTMVTVTYKPTITMTATYTETPVVLVPSYTPTTTITIPETHLESATVLAETKTMTVDGAVETITCDANTLVTRDSSACSDSAICEPFPLTMTFEPDEVDQASADPLDAYALDMYNSWTIVPASETPFTNAESQNFLKYVPLSSAPEDASAVIEHGGFPVFNATSAFLGCTHPDKDDDCNVLAEGFAPGANPNMVQEEFTIPACALGQEKTCALQYHQFPSTFTGLTRLVFHVKDSGKAQTFWMDNLAINTKAC